VNWAQYSLGRREIEDRYGARAFFTLKGYASRNRETELPSPTGGRTATVVVLV
jgi:hypothetical protein